MLTLIINIMAQTLKAAALQGKHHCLQRMVRCLMEWEEIVHKTSEYILGLPDRANMTMYQAVQSACPGVELENVIDVVFFNYLDEIVETVEKTGAVILDYSAHEGLYEGMPFNMDFIVRRKRIQKAQIISDLLCYGPGPAPEDAIEQRVTISSTGRVWFTEYVFGKPGAPNHPIGRRKQLFIGKCKALAILSFIADYVDSGPELIGCTDIGDWYLTITDPAGKKKQLSCSMCGGIIIGGIDLTDYIREMIPIDGLAVFGGGSDHSCR